MPMVPTIVTSSHRGDARVASEVDWLVEGQARMEKSLANICAEQQKVYLALIDCKKDLRRLISSGQDGPPLRPSAGPTLEPAPEGREAYTIAVLPAATEAAAAQLRPEELELQAAQAGGASNTSSLAVAAAALAVRLEDGTDSSTEAPPAAQLSGGYVSPGLPQSWPATLKMRRGLTLELVKEMRSLGNFSDYSSKRLSGLRRSDDSRITPPKLLHRSASTLFSDENPAAWLSAIMRRCMMDPNCTQHVMFDIASLVFLLWDLTVIPFVLAWDHPTGGFLRFAAWFTTVFWTIDILVTFSTGFYKGGKLELGPRAVARHYLRTWFFPDIMIVGCDWLSMIILAVEEDSGGPTESFKILRFAKLGRLLRIVALLRMTKFTRSLEEYAEKNLSETWRMAMRIGFLFCFTLWLSHWMSCVWILIGRLGPTDTGMRWTDAVTTTEDVELPFIEAGGVYQYMTAFHWSVAQITLGAIEISCSNSAERIFNVFCLLIGLLFGSWLVSSLSAAMVEYQMMMKEHNVRFRRLRQFLRENDVSRRIAIRVQRQAAERESKQDRLGEKDVEALMLLSSSLRTELRFEIFHHHLDTHGLFRFWTTADSTMMHRLCSSFGFVDFIFLRAGDDLFVPGTPADKAYLLVHGSIKYDQEPDTSAVDALTTCHVSEGDWICEAALWAEWIHVGKAECITPCRVVYVSGDGVTQALQKHSVVRDVTLEYCRLFLKRVVASQPPSAPYPTDLKVPFTDFSDIVCSMNKDIQATIGLAAIEHMEMEEAAKTWGGRRVHRLDKLKEEIVYNKSTVMLNMKGEVERVVSVLALHIEDNNGRVLYQLGKVEDGRSIDAACQLPGGKMEQGEVFGETLDRILRQKLAPIASQLQVKGTHQDVFWKLSREYGVNTKYTKTICSTTLQGELDMPRYCARTADVSPRRAHSDSVLGHMLPRPVFIIRDKSRKLFYTWLSREESEHLGAHGGEADLLCWLTALKDSIVAVSI